MADNHNAAADSAPGVNNLQQNYILGNPSINMQGDMHSNKRLKTSDTEYSNFNYLHSGDLNSAICPTVIDNNNLANSQPNSIGQLNSTGGVVINSQPTVVSSQQAQPGQHPPQQQQQHLINSSMLPKSGNPQQSQTVNAGRQLPNMLGHPPQTRPLLGGPQQRMVAGGQMTGTLHSSPMQVISQPNNAQQTGGPGQQQFLNVNQFPQQGQQQQQPTGQMGHRLLQNPSGNVQAGQQQYRFLSQNINHQPSVSIPQISGSQPNQGPQQLGVAGGTPSQPAQGQQAKPSQTPQQAQQGQPTGPMAFSMNPINSQQPRTILPIDNQGAYPLNTDNEKRKLIQQQLVLLLHAHKCQRREQQQQQRINGNEQFRQCNLPHCPTMKNVLAHMVTCNTGKNCTVPHCSSSKQIINHWKNCPRVDCPVCLPLKQANERRPADRQGSQSSLSMDGNGPNSLSVNIPQIGLASQPKTLQNQPQQGMAPQQQMNSLQNSQGPIMQQDMQRTYQILDLPFNSQPNVVNQAQFGGPTQPQGREWHAGVNADLRKHLVQKIVQAIFPNHDQNAGSQNQRLNNLLNYAERVELDMFSRATSREEYYHFLAEKIYRIKKELDEKRQKRREQQQQMGHAVQNQMGTGPRPQMNNGVGPMRPPMPNSMSGPQLGSRMGLGPNMGQQNNQPFSGQGDVGSQQQQQQTPQNQNQTNMSQFYMNNSNNQNGSPSPGPQQIVSVSGMQQSNANFRSITTSNTNSGGYAISITPSSTNPNGLSQQPQQQPGQQSQPQQQQVPPNSVNTQSIHQNSSSTTTSNLHNILSNNSNSSATTTNNNNNTSTNSNTNNALQPTSQASMLGQTSQRSSPQFKNDFFSDVNIKSEVMQTDDNLSSTGNCETQSLSSTTSDFDKLTGQTNSVTNNFGDNAVVGQTESAHDDNNSVTVKMEHSSSMKIKAEPFSPPNSIQSNKSPKQEIVDTKTKIEPASTATEATPVQKVKPKVFGPGEIRGALMPVLDKLFKQEESFPFRVPVDPLMLNIPDYLDIIKNPMDLSTIKQKLENDQYEDPWGFVNDVCLMLDNAWLYNRKTSKVYRCCTKLSEIFMQEIDPAMQSLGYCCGRKHVFQPQVLCCFGKQLCTIPRDAKYMNYKDRYTYCMKCFSDIPGDKVVVSDLSFDPTVAPTTTLSKSEFVEAKNDHLEYEQFITCKDCRRKLHQICMVHYDPIWPEGFTCNNCLASTNRKKAPNRFTAKRLPVTKLGSFLENRVNNFLRKKECGAGEVSIRVVSSSDKIVEVRSGMKQKYCDNHLMNESFPYRAKALFAFEEIDGTDVCFFGMHVQEYGSECPQPNHRRVYIAYLDSVYYFRPKQYRTAVYHEILLGYLDYAKQLGYTMAHIWACPPSEGDDYIFHCHPTEQKIPKPKRLQEWYKKMLDKGIIERIVLDYKDILKQATEDNLKTAAELPYFEGDFWPNVLEESIKEIELEQAKQQNEKSDMMDDDSNDNFDPDDGDTSKSKEKNKKNNSNKKSSKKQNSRKNNSNSRVKGGPISNQNSQLTPSQQFDANLAGKVYATMEKHKEVFFVVRLHSSQSAASLPPVNDPDPLMACELMDGRDAFLTLARDKHYEFSSLRRCKFSTMAMLYELHTNGNDRFMYTCNNCKRSMGEARYHCSQCDDFDLCIPCYNADGHPHAMDRVESNDPVLSFGATEDMSGHSAGDMDNSGEAGSSAPGENRRNIIQRCVESLMHACQCRDANCRRPTCNKLKRVIQHTKHCKRKNGTDGSNKCLVCKQLVTLCCYHAKQCEDPKCPVPYCVNIKQRMKAQQMQQRLRTAQIVSRRIASMAQMNYSSSNSANTNDQYMSHSKPAAATPPPVGAMHAAQQAQQVAQRQQNPPNSYGKGGGGGGKGGGGKGGGGKSFPFSNQSAGGGKGMPQMNSNHVQGQGPQQRISSDQQQWFGSQQGPSQQQGSQQMMMRTPIGGKPQGQGPMMGPIGGQQQGGMHIQNNSILVGNQHGGNNFQNSTQQNVNNDIQQQQQQTPQRQSLQTLLMQLKSNSQNNKELVCALKAQPELMTTIIKLKQQQGQQQHGPQQQQQPQQQQHPQMANNQQIMGQSNQMPQQNHNTNQQWNTGNQYQQPGQPRMINPRAPFQQNARPMMQHQIGNSLPQQGQQQQQGGQQMFVTNQGQQRYWNPQQNMQQGMRGPQVMRSPPNQMVNPRMAGPRFGMQTIGQPQQDQEMMMYQQQQQQQDFNQINQPELTNQD